MKVLALDTSGQLGSVALLEDGVLVAEWLLKGILNRNEALLPLLDQLLGLVGWSLPQVDAFAGVRGPGSFTGVRIGLATLEGFGLAMGKPVLGLSGLEALALGLPAAALPILAVLDHRRSEVYAAVYRWREGQLEELLPGQILDPAQLLTRLSGPYLVVGDAARSIATLLAGNPAIHPTVVTSSSGQLRASVVGAWAMERLLQAPAHPWPPLTPLYLRASEAEVRADGLRSDGSGADKGAADTARATPQ